MEAGEPSPNDEFDRCAVIEEIRRVGEEVGRQPPAKSDMDTHGRMSSMTAADRFGSWNDALLAAGYDEGDLRAGPADETGRDEYVQALGDLADDLGRPPNPTEFRELAGHHDSTALKWFDSWESMIEAEGYDAAEMATATHQTRQAGEQVIERVCDDLEVDDGVRQAADGVWQSFCNAASPQGMGVDCLATGCVAVAARTLDAAVSLDDVFAAADTEHSMSSAYRKVCRNVDIAVTPPDPAAYVEPVADDLAVSDEVLDRAESLVESYVEAGEHTGRDHWGIAGAALYAIDDAAGRGEIRQKDAAEAADVCLVTVRSRWEEMKPYLDGIDLDDVPEPEPDPEQATAIDPDSHDGEAVIVLEGDDKHVEVETTSVATQTDAMIKTLRVLDAEFGLFDALDMPYVPARCKRAFLTDDPCALDDDRRYSWVQVEDAVYVDTKIDRGAKERRLKQVAEMVGVTVGIPDAAAIGERSRGGRVKEGSRPDWLKAD